MKPAVFAVGFAAVTAAVIVVCWWVLDLLADGIAAGLNLLTLSLGA